MEELGVSAVSEGAAEGYRIGDLAQSPYLSQTGLQPGDVILSVNGRPVGDLDQDRLELANVLAEGSARLEVQRGTRRFFVTASLQQ
ncbi:MAG: PDZ domain-containing protein [Gammaproteobacteria bacterium]|nr:PDZ domain-containing protein [Gammaproteobacteria bacterium]